MSDLTRSAVTDISVVEITSARHKTKAVPPRDFYALSYRYAGEISIVANGKRLLSTPDTVTFTPKGLPYSTAVRADTRMTVVHFRLAKDLEGALPAVVNAKGSELKQLFLHLGAAYKVGKPLDFECMSVFYQILASLERLSLPTSNVPPCLAAATQIIDAEFADARLGVAAIAARVGVSDSYLRRVFHTARGESPVEYLMRVRIRYAKNLLQTEYLTIAQIAAQCGFNSSCYFIQCFKRHTGQTPAEYRKRKEAPRS